jgi:hypothetical protein
MCRIFPLCPMAKWFEMQEINTVDKTLGTLSMTDESYDVT